MKFFKTTLIAATLLASLSAFAQEATIRKNLVERLPQLPKIDEVSKSPIPGLFEIRVNSRAKPAPRRACQTRRARAMVPIRLDRVTDGPA